MCACQTMSNNGGVERGGFAASHEFYEVSDFLVGGFDVSVFEHGSGDFPKGTSLKSLMALNSASPSLCVNSSICLSVNVGVTTACFIVSSRRVQCDDVIVKFLGSIFCDSSRILLTSPKFNFRSVYSTPVVGDFQICCSIWTPFV